MSDIQEIMDQVERNVQACPLNFPGNSTAYLDEAISKIKIDGMWLEFGVWVGQSIGHLSTKTKQVFGFDTFEGLPEPWDGNRPGYLTLGGRPPALPENVIIIKGLFQDTLPGFLAEHNEQAALVHVDCDIYSGASFVLEQLEKRIHPGAVILFDELTGYPDYKRGELLALGEFLHRTGRNVTPICTRSGGRHVSVAFEIK